MADITIIHPGTGGQAAVSPEALEHHYRQSGWMTLGEWDEYQARLAEREQEQAKAAKPAAKSSSKTAESEGK